MRWLLAWILYELGDLASDVMYVWDKYVGVGTIYPVYNKLMGWSCMVQGDSDNGPWSAAEDETMSESDAQNACSILFDPPEDDIIHNLEGALYDLEHQFDPKDGGVCARTIRRAIVQLEIARKFMRGDDYATLGDDDGGRAHTAS